MKIYILISKVSYYCQTIISFTVFVTVLHVVAVDLQTWAVEGHVWLPKLVIC